jgi:hypothetical protein
LFALLAGAAGTRGGGVLALALRDGHFAVALRWIVEPFQSMSRTSTAGWRPSRWR